MEPIIEFESVTGEGAKPLYACGSCKMLPSDTQSKKNTIEAARECCLCTRCGKVEKKTHRTVCEECHKILEKERRDAETAERKAEEAALPFAEYDGGPVFWDGTDRFFDDIDECAEAIYNDGEEDTAIVYPCIVSKLSVPSLVEMIEERWYDELEDAELRQEDKDALEAVERQIEAPTMWIPITNEKIRIPVIERDDD